MLLMPLGMISRLPPYNLTISNVPGMRETMYWNGARMDGSYPLSIITDGMALNITLVSYAGQVDFGIIACRRSVPQVQRLIDYMEEALQELEDAAGLKAKPTRKRSSSRTSTRTKAKAKPKPKPKTKTKTKTKTKAKAKAKAKPQPKSSPKAKPKPKTKAKTRANASARAGSRVTSGSTRKKAALEKSKSTAKPRKKGTRN
jgi:hypothetical protein